MERWSGQSLRFRSSGYSNSDEQSVPFVVIDDWPGEEPANDNYYITFPDDDSDLQSSKGNTPERFTPEEIKEDDGSEKSFCTERDIRNAAKDYYRESNFLQPNACKGGRMFVEDYAKPEREKVRYVQKIEAVSDFDINFDAGEETVPIVYLQTTRAACLQRAFRNAGYKKLGEGVELTLGELRAMALRQQQQIDTQHQLLCAKEQRLRYLKQQEARQHQVALEGERLRRLRERVEAQEVKLRKLRALRGHVDRNKQANAALTSDLESIRALFNEKEKELSVAVAKVEELTRQLEELRRGDCRPAAPPPAAHELDKLRRELMYRNKLNEQQNGRLSAQRSALGARQEEMRSIDRRVSELQARLLRKRALNRQLAAAHRQGQRMTNPPSVQLSNYPPSGATSVVNGHIKSQARGNVAAVEPYNHVPHAPSLAHNQNIQVLKQNAGQNSAPLKQLSQNDNINLAHHVMQQEAHYLQQKQMANPLYNVDKQMNSQLYNGGYLQDQYLPQYPSGLNHVQQGIGNPYPTPSDQKMIQDLVNKYADVPKIQYSPNSQKEPKINEQEFLPEFAASKSDPKYQTLPYNTKFPTNTPAKKGDKLSSEAVNELLKLAQNPNPTVPNVSHMTVHSTPLSVVNKSLATPLSPAETAPAYHAEQHAYHIQKSDSTGKCNLEGKENSAYPHNSRLSQDKQASGKALQKNDAAKGAASVSSASSNSSAASNSVGFVIVRNTASGLSSSGSANFGTQNASTQSILLSPPQSASTPLSTPDVSGSDKSTPKPALPPKPAIKTPPRQSAASDAPHATDHNCPPLPSSDTSDNDTPHSQKEQSNGSAGGDMIIKARPLTIRKPPLSEQPKLKNLNSTTKNGISVSINRRIEMPPAFLFPEMDHLTLDAASEAQNGLQKSDKINGNNRSRDELDKASGDDDGKNVVSDIAEQIGSVDLNNQNSQSTENIVRRSKKGNLKQGGKAPLTRRVSFDPLALLLDASLEGELELVKKTATQVQNASAANDEGITALHNAICAGHFEIVKFLVEIGCDVNAQDSDGWTPLHCAASCNNLPVVRFLVDNGACIFATTLSDHETAAEKCEEDEEGFDGCSEYLYSVQEKLGIMNGGAVYSVFAYSAQRADELSFGVGERLQVLRKGDDNEREWWWGGDTAGREGYIPRNLLGLYPRVAPSKQE